MAVDDILVSPAWGSRGYPIKQEFGTYSEDTAHMYPAEYTVPLGWPEGTHIGLDVGMSKGTRLFALNPGKVIQSGPSPFFRPNPVWIETIDNPETVKDESGYIEIYGHMWTNRVAAGQQVKQGDFIGTSGEQTITGTMTPDGTGEHLHFELRRPEGAGKYRAVNPRNWLTISQTEPSDTENEINNDIPDISGIDTSIFDTLKDLSNRVVIIAIGIVLLAIALISIIR